jgi:hypothetical protein
VEEMSYPGGLKVTPRGGEFTGKPITSTYNSMNIRDNYKSFFGTFFWCQEKLPNENKQRYIKSHDTAPLIRLQYFFCYEVQFHFNRNYILAVLKVTIVFLRTEGTGSSPIGKSQS